MLKKFQINEEVASQLMLFDANDYGNAQSLELLFGDKFCYVVGWGVMYYNGTHWEMDAEESHLYMAATETLNVRRSLAIDNEKEAIKKCTSADYRRVGVTAQYFIKLPGVIKKMEDFNTDKDLLNVKNGVLNLRTGELSPHCPTYGFSYCCNVNWNPDADPSFFLDWLGKVMEGFEDEEVRTFLQMCVGYTLTGHTREEKMFYVYGPTRAGKGTFLDIIHAILGKPLGGATQFDTFTKKRDGSDQGFDLAPLQACRFVSASESPQSAKMNEAVVKNITGNDPISCAHKNKDRFSFKPQWKIWAISNNPPKGEVTDDAFWGRFVAFSFPHSNLGKEDTHLKDKLIQPENLEGAFLWMVQGAMKWFQVDRLSAPKFNQGLLDGYRLQLDYVQQWLDDNCIADPNNQDAFTPMKDLYDDFRRWCEDSGKGDWGKDTVAKNLNRKKFVAGKKRLRERDIKGNEVGPTIQKRGYFGIILKDSVAF